MGEEKQLFFICYTKYHSLYVKYELYNIALASGFLLKFDEHLVAMSHLKYPISYCSEAHTLVIYYIPMPPTTDKACRAHQCHQLSICLQIFLIKWKWWIPIHNMTLEMFVSLAV